MIFLSQSAHVRHPAKHHRFNLRSILVKFGDLYLLLLLAAILTYIWIFAGLAFDQHAGMRTHKADLGQIDQAVWNSSRGRFLETVQEDYVTSRLTDHVEPALALISPVFWLWNDVRALLLLQVLVLAAGAVPLYALARRKMDQLLAPDERDKIWHWEPLQQLTRPIALSLALAYLLAPQLQSASLTEFHAIPLSVPLILWSLWAVETKHWLQFCLATLLVALVKEEAALLAAGLGAWAVWRLLVVSDRNEAARTGRSSLAGSAGHRLSRAFRSYPIWLALVVTALSLVWFYVATFVIVPSYALEVYDVAESSYFQRYGALGNSPVDIFKSFFTRPHVVWQIATESVRLDYLLGLLMVFGFTSLLAPELLLICLPVLLANLLSAFPPQYYGEFHYSAPLVPYFSAAAAYGTARLWRLLARRASGQSGSFQHMSASSAPVMALVSLFTNSQSSIRPLIALGLVIWHLVWAGAVYIDTGRGPLGSRYDPTPTTDHHRLLSRFTEQIPPDAAVSATAAVHPHVSHRRFVYQFPWGIEPDERAGWALLDVTTNTDMAPGDLQAIVYDMLARDWGVVDAADGYLLLAQDMGRKSIPDAFFDFARAGTIGGNENPVRPTDLHTDSTAAFGPLTHTGVSLTDWPRWRQTKITTYWKIEENYKPGTVRPRIEVRTPGGETVYTHDQIPPPALVWYPPQQWQPGEVIRIETLWHFLPQTWGIVVGAVHEPDPTTAPDAHGTRLPVVTTGNLEDATGTLAVSAAYIRRQDSTLAPLPVDANLLSPTARVAGAGSALPATPGPQCPLVGALADRAAPTMAISSGGFGAEQSLLVDGCFDSHSRPLSHPIDLWLQWRHEDSPLWRSHQPFVHLRLDGENVAQVDGPPRYFVILPSTDSRTPDWRQIRLPDDAQPGTYEIVAGLYNPETGERLPAFDLTQGVPTSERGQLVDNELRLGEVQVAPRSTPDQACALIPATCASQPLE